MGTEYEKTIETESLNPVYPYMPRAEWERRISKARSLMAEKDIDAILILNGQDALYFFGREKAYKSGFPFIGIIPREGATTLVSENEYARNLITIFHIKRMSVN